uniref:DNRLRE domain-containing protein n=1 Tax=Clostridium sp. UBA4548 TaxID=1946361 RepID=UPI0025C34774
MGKFKRLIVVATLITFLTTTMPFQVLASDINTKPEKIESNQSKTNEEITEAEKAAVKIVDEVEEKREPNIKHYLLEDKTYEAVIYNYPVHYFKDGQWKDIDNSLSETMDKRTLDEELVNEQEVKESPKVEEKKTSEDESKKESSSEIKTSEGESKEVPKTEDKVTPESKEKETPKAEEKPDTKTEEAKNKPLPQDNVQASGQQNNPSSQAEKNNSILNFGKSKGKEAEKVFENKSNSFKFKLAKKGDSKRLVTISKDKYEISWSLQNAAKVTGELSEYNENKINKEIEEKANGIVNNSKNASLKSKSEKNLEKQNIVENEKKKILPNITSSVNFRNILKDVDLNYQLVSDKVKENLIINKNIEDSIFTYNIEVKNLTAVKQEDNSVIFYDKNDKSKEIFLIKAPFMFDSKGIESTDIQVKVEETKKGYSLILIPSKEWLNDKNRAYPVTIDPDIETDLSRNGIMDTFVTSVADPDNKYNNQYLRVGKHKTSGTIRSLIKFNIPSITTADMVVAAQLDLFSYEAPVENAISVHKVTSHWISDENHNLAWSNQPSVDSTIEDYSIANEASKWFSWDVTEMVKSWYLTGNNYGLMLKSTNESIENSAFWSADMDDYYRGARPRIIVKYINNSGLENYWTYHSQDIGRAGTGYINDYNGNLILKHNDLIMNGSRMPVNITHVFNSNYKTEKTFPSFSDTSSFYGAGWRLNLSQIIEPKVIQDKQHYMYTDEDGTKHYFKLDSTTGKYKEEFNQELTLELNYNNGIDIGYLIKDTKDNKLVFLGNGLLYKIIDANKNELVMTYNGKTLTKVTDGAGRQTIFQSNPYGTLTSIIDPDNKKTSFTYGANWPYNLETITYPDGKKTTYQYDINNNLKEAINFDGLKISYTYYNSQPYRVNTVSQNHNNGTQGESLIINYGRNLTTFTDISGRVNTYQFDNLGKTINVKDAEGNAQHYKYGDSENSKKLTTESKLQKTVNNILPNHGCEKSTNWTVASDGGAGSGVITSEDKHYGNQSIKISKTNNISKQYMQQEVNLTPGKTYTLSAYVKTVTVSNTNNNGAKLAVHYLKSDGTYEEKFSKSINGSHAWQRLQVTFTLPADTPIARAIIRPELTLETGIAYFDDLQLEEGCIANRYNLVENGDFSGTGTIPDWWWNNSLETGDSLVSTSDSSHPSILDNNVLKIIGGYNKSKSIGSAIYLSGKTGDTFNLSAWAKADSVPKGVFDISVAFVNGSQVKWVIVPFNKNNHDWQYISEIVKAPMDYTRVDMNIFYSNNANTAYFDGIQFYKEEFGDSFAYDDKGNLISVKDISQRNSTFKYNGTNDLISTTDPKGNEFKYDYDTKHNVTKATTAENKNYKFNYDSYGNPLSAAVDDGTNQIGSSANYTANGNYISSMFDSFGNKVAYNYNQTKGTLDSVTDAKGKSTSYTYDILNRLTEASKVAGTQTIKNSYSYENDRIKTVTHNDFNYNFGYDSLGNNTSVSVGSQNLITNTIEERSGKLLNSTYGNGRKVGNIYDGYDNLIGNYYGNENNHHITYSGNIEKMGIKTVNGNDSILGTIGQNLGLESLSISLTDVPAGMHIKYQAHVQELGWQNWVSDGATAGTIGQGLRMEAVRIKLEGAPIGYIVQYQVNVQGIGWMNPVTDGELSGTTGQGLKIEAIKIKVVKLRNSYKYDANSNLGYKQDFINEVNYLYSYDLSNRLTKVDESNGNYTAYGYDNNNNTNRITEKITDKIYTTNYGFDKDNRANSVTYNKGVESNISYSYDTLGRLKNKGIVLGSSTYNTSYNYRKGTVSNTNLSYQGLVQSQGWQDPVSNGAECGTTGKQLALQGIKVSITNAIPGMRVKYKAHISNVGWESDWLYDGTQSGDTANNIEAIQVILEGAPEGYHIQYQVHVAEIGWMDPVVDGAIAGTTGKSLSVEGIKINLIKPGSTESSQIESIKYNNDKTINYTYDANGNIDTISQYGNPIKFYYNELNELIREDNKVTNKTITYSYDIGGNITSKIEYPYTTANPITVAATSTINYGYTDTNWKDKLTSYNGKAITYDEIGNPLTYDGYTYTWEMGRQLKSINKTGQTITYKYDDSGIRTEKTVNGVKTSYNLIGDKVTYEDNGTDKVYYTYDANGKLLSMNLRAPDSYSNDLYELVGSETAIQLSGSNSAAEKFNATKPFDRVSVNCPSWSNNIGNLTLSLYKWKTDYNTTISASPIASKQFQNYTDNQWLELKVNEQSSGEYLWVLSNPSENVGVWKSEGSTNSSTAYLNGSVVSGDYTSKISYKTNEYYYIRNAQGDIIGLID